jgi:hypothetical protein
VLEHSRPRLWGSSKARCCVSDLRLPDSPDFLITRFSDHRSTNHPINR